MNRMEIAQETIRSLRAGDEVDIHEHCPSMDTAVYYRVGRELGIPVSTRILRGRWHVRLREVKQ